MLSKIVLQIINLNTSVDVIRVPKTRTSGKKIPIDINFIKNLFTEREASEKSPLN